MDSEIQPEITPMVNRMKLELSDALQKAFNPPGFDRMLHLRVDKRRYDFVGDQEFPEIVYQVIEAADRENWLAQLIAGAKEANPGNIQLQAFIEKYPEYNPSNPPAQRENITGVLRDTQIVINEKLVIFQNASQETQDKIDVISDYTTLHDAFQDTLDKIDVISDYMTLHDELYNLTFAVFPLVLEASRLLPNSKDAKSSLARYDKIIRNAIEVMREAAARKNIDEEESEWIEELDRARKQLKAVLDDFDKENLQSALQSIQDILETQPTRIDRELWVAMNSQNERLPQLIEILEKVLSDMTRITPPPAGMPQFEMGLESLKTLRTKIDVLLREHAAWQEVTGLLPYIGDWIDSDLSKFKIKWQRLRAMVVPFYIGKTDEETAVDLQIVDAQMEQALRSTEGRAPAMAAFDPRIFNEYRVKASWRFYDVTQQLLKRVEYLREIRNQLLES